MVKRVSATDLAKLGKCEKQLVLNKIYKNTILDEEVDKKRIEGIKEHKVFENNNKIIMEQQSNKVVQYQNRSDKRCYIATSLYGINSPKTIFLRKWRDEVLSKYKLGRLFIKFYYKFSPILIRKTPCFLKPIFRIIINIIILKLKKDTK